MTVSEYCTLVRIACTHIGFHASSFDTLGNPRYPRGKLLPWPCNMWHLVPKRKRNRSGHRRTTQVAPVPIIFSRLPGALSTRSFDVSERPKCCCLYGGVTLPPFRGFVLSVTHSVLSAKWGGKKKTERKSSGLGHRRHLRASPMTRISELREFAAVPAALTSV